MLQERAHEKEERLAGCPFKPAAFAVLLRTEHDIGVVALHGGVELAQPFRLFFQVVVNGEHQFAACLRQPGAYGLVLPEITRQIHHHHAGICPLDGQQPLQRAVGGAVVHENNFVIGRQLLCAGRHSPVEFLQEILHLVGGGNDRKGRGVRVGHRLSG